MRERERLEAERKIDRLKRELQELRETQQALETNGREHVVRSGGYTGGPTGEP